MLRVVVVDDDYRLADLHSEVVRGVEGFQVCATAHTAAAAGNEVRQRRPDLLLLDLYLPDGCGLEVLRGLRADGVPVDAIVLTAAGDMARVRDAVRLGTLQYLIKPFSLPRLREHLIGYQRRQRHLQWTPASQGLVDRTFQLMRASAEQPEKRPEGNPTVQSVLSALRIDDWLSANDIAERIGISVSTARRYLSRLVALGKIELSLQYGVAGRPTNLYRRSCHRAA